MAGNTASLMGLVAQPASAASDAVASPGALGAKSAVVSHPASVAYALATGSSDDWRNLLSPEAWRELITNSLHAGLEIVLVAGLVFLALKGWKRLVERAMSLAHEALPGESQTRLALRSETLAGMVGSLGKALILFMGTMIILSRLGLNVAPILASAGIFGVAVGFGAQSLVKDVISGFFILLEDQYGVGDSVEINTHSGTVERMNLRVTQVRDAEGRLISIPNGKVEVVVNASKGWGLATVEVTVGALVPPEQAIAALEASLEGLAEAHSTDLLGPVELVGVEGLGSGAATLKAQARTRPGRQHEVARAMRQAVWVGMPKHGISPLGFPEGLGTGAMPTALYGAAQGTAAANPSPAAAQVMGPPSPGLEGPSTPN